jgi:hypothetical protein
MSALKDITDLDAALIIMDADRTTATLKSIATAHEPGAKTAVYLVEEHSDANDAACSGGTGLVLAQRPGKGLFGACQRLIEDRSPPPRPPTERLQLLHGLQGLPTPSSLSRSFDTVLVLHPVRRMR